MLRHRLYQIVCAVATFGTSAVANAAAPAMLVIALPGMPTPRPSFAQESEALSWRPMAEADLDAVAAAARLGFPDHFEGRECFANRLAVYPAGCFALADEARGNDEPRGYLIAYPWRDDDAPALNILINSIPPDAAVMYLHDLALHPSVRGAGHSYAIVDRLMADAISGGWPAITLVAVNNAVAFWQRHGFRVREVFALREKLLASYGPEARFMARELPGDQTANGAPSTR